MRSVGGVCTELSSDKMIPEVLHGTSVVLILYKLENPFEMSPTVI